jgi:hypothetical protein
MTAVAEHAHDMTEDRLAARNALPVVFAAAILLAWGTLARRPNPV